jgi:hypothetical protein
VRGGHADLRDHRQLAVEVLEDVLEDRDQERDQGEHHDHREHPDHHRVGHRRPDLAAQRVRLLELVRDPHQRLLEHSCRLTGPHHRDVELVEDVRVLLKRVGQRDSRLDVLAHVAEDLLQLLVLGLVLEHVERAQDRHTGRHHGRQLPRHHGQLLRLDPLEALEQVLARDPRLLLDDVEDDQPALAKFVGDRLLRAGVQLALSRHARNVNCSEGVSRHP